MDFIAAGKHLTCGIKRNMHVECWGINTYVIPEIINKYKMVASGGRHSCGLKNGDIKCVGDNT